MHWGIVDVIASMSWWFELWIVATKVEVDDMFCFEQRHSAMCSKFNDVKITSPMPLWRSRNVIIKWRQDFVVPIGPIPPSEFVLIRQKMNIINPKSASFLWNPVGLRTMLDRVVIILHSATVKTPIDIRQGFTGDTDKQSVSTDSTVYGSGMTNDSRFSYARKTSKKLFYALHIRTITSEMIK